MNQPVTRRPRLTFLAAAPLLLGVLAVAAFVHGALSASSAASSSLVPEANFNRAVAQVLGATQVVGVAVTTGNAVLVLDRRGRIWGADTFEDSASSSSCDTDGSCQVLGSGFRDAIAEPVVHVLDAETGNPARAAWGHHMLRLPHAIAVGAQPGTVYLVDVGAHTVLQVETGSDPTVVRTLGEANVPGNDAGHFCQPTDVAVGGGILFVSDGYCNNRIARFNASTGLYLSAFGTMGVAPGSFNLPHAVAVCAKHRRLFVADRLNGRIQVFDYDGHFITLLAFAAKSTEPCHVYAVAVDDVAAAPVLRAGIRVGDAISVLFTIPVETLLGLGGANDDDKNVATLDLTAATAGVAAPVSGTQGGGAFVLLTDTQQDDGAAGVREVHLIDVDADGHVFVAEAIDGAKAGALWKFDKKK